MFLRFTQTFDRIFILLPGKVYLEIWLKCILSCSYRTFSFIPYFWKPKKCINKNTVKYNKNILHIRCQILHVSTPRCHHQDVLQLQMLVGPTYIFGTIHSHFHNKSCVNWSFQHFKAFNFHDGNMNTIYIPQTVLQQANTYGFIVAPRILKIH